ncbi:MAG TPA: EamA family transporter [Candidatus Paceibacterota bacterium]|nr:EamA family transporter [Candidatus Paceibacterota bacterium]
MWMLYAFLSAVLAAATAIFGKIGVQGVDSTLATTLRAVVMTVFLLPVAWFAGSFSKFSGEFLGSKVFGFIVLSAVAGALSWIFYFLALQTGTASGVSAIDRLSIVLVIIFAALFLGEALTVKTALGALLISAGAVLIAFK